MVVMNESSLIAGLAGGALIGATTAGTMILTGKLTGLSGIFAEAVTSIRGAKSWAGAFTAGFLVSGAALSVIYPKNFAASGGGHDTWRYAMAGFLVGFGTRLGNGCTSGHGISGLARLSRRSLTAVIVFLTSAAAAATSLQLNGVLTKRSTAWDQPDRSAALAVVGVAAAFAAASLHSAISTRNVPSYIATVAAGGIFAAGLSVSGMVNRSKVLGFLVLEQRTWDPSVPMVMLAAVPVAALGFSYAKSRGTPLLGGGWLDFPVRKDIDLPLILGSWLFGVGWGICGLCPGPAVLQAAAGTKAIYSVYLPCMVAGMVCAKTVVHQLQKPKRN